MSNSKVKVSNEQIIEACQTSITMMQACKKVGLHFNTFVRRAKQLNCYKPNQGGKGLKKPTIRGYLLNDILDNKHDGYATLRIKNRLLEEGIFQHQCVLCKKTKWNGLKIPLELDNIDGNRFNHNLQNLRLLCPNCHAQTETYRGKNSKHKI